MGPTDVHMKSPEISSSKIISQNPNVAHVHNLFKFSELMLLFLGTE
jgi:hypothetical protein